MAGTGGGTGSLSRERAMTQTGAQAPGYCLDIAGVSKSFPSRNGPIPVLENITLRVGQGEFISLIGPTGCGKSTLLRVIAGLTRADSGTVSVFGESPDAAAAAKRIGFVPQSPALLPWRTVLENVKLPFQVNRNADRSRAVHYRDPAQTLEAFGLGAVLNRHPRQLSGGMQQRTAIARALVFDPSVLLMDEPFSALDELTREQQRHYLLDTWQSDQKTVVFVTHSVPEAVVLSDAVAVLSPQPGRIRAVIPVGLPRPRDRLVEATAAFHEVEHRVRAEMRRPGP